jgi:hypothetical protein
MSTITFGGIDIETRKALVRIQRTMREELRRLDDHASLLPPGRANTACAAVMDWLNHSMADIEDSLS